MVRKDDTQHCLKEFMKYVSLNIIGMLGLSCYILADTFFVAKGLGADGLAALNIAIPVYSFVNGCGLMLGVGGSTKYTVFKSRGEDQTGGVVFYHSLLLGLCFAILFLAAGLFLSGSIAGVLGAEGMIYGMSKTYLKVILLFAPMFLLNNILICFVRNDGAPQMSMAAMLGGSLSNVILDYIFIFPLEMGIFGAVLATGLAPVISVIILLPYFIKGRSGFRFTKGPVSGKLCSGVLSGGLPSLVTEVSAGVVIILFNWMILNLQGNTGVAAYGIIANLSLVVIAVYTGIAQGIQPMLSRYHGNGYAYGLGGSAGIQKVMKYTVILLLGISGLVYMVVFFGSSWIVAAFNSEQNPLLQTIAEDGMKIYFTGIMFAGLNIILSIYFTSTECARPAQFISLMRGFVLIIPAALILPRYFGVAGVWWAFPLTELIVSLLGLLLFLNARQAKPIDTAAEQAYNGN